MNILYTAVSQQRIRPLNDCMKSISFVKIIDNVYIILYLLET